MQQPLAKRRNQSTSERSHARWFVVALGAIFVMQLVVNAIRPTVSYRALDLGASGADLGLIAAGFAVLSLALAIPAGRMIDRQGEIPFIIAGLVLVTAVAFSLIIVNTIWALAVTQAVLGAGQLLATVGAQALIANSDPAHRDSRFGAFTVVVSSGQLVGPALAGVIGQHFTLSQRLTPGRGTILAGSSVFLVAGVLGILGCALAISMWRTGTIARGSQPGSTASVSLFRSIGRILRQPNAPHAIFVSIAVLTTTDLLVAYLPAYGEAAGLSTTAVGLLLSTRAAASMLSRIFLGVLTRRLGRAKLLITSTALPALVLAPLAVVHELPISYLIMALAGFGLGLGQPLSLIWIAEAAPAGMRGTAVGVRLSGNRLGQIVVPALVGTIVGATGLGAVFVALSIMLVSSSAVTARGTFPPADS